MSQLPPQIEFISIDLLKPYPRNARVHSRKQVRQIASSIQRFGFTNPVLVSDDREIIAGHGRVLAARELAIATVPTIRLSHLSPEERRAYVLADNKLALNAGWDSELLAIEFQGLIDLGFDLTLTGFAAAEIDLTLDHARESASNGPGPADVIPDLPDTPADVVSRPGDLWSLGRHRLLCGDARSGDAVARVLAGARADLVFTDPPFRHPIRFESSADATLLQHFQPRSSAQRRSNDPRTARFGYLVLAKALRPERASAEGLHRRPQVPRQCLISEVGRRSRQGCRAKDV